MRYIYGEKEKNECIQMYIHTNISWHYAQCISYEHLLYKILKKKIVTIVLFFYVVYDIVLKIK